MFCVASVSPLAPVCLVDRRSSLRNRHFSLASRRCRRRSPRHKSRSLHYDDRGIPETHTSTTNTSTAVKYVTIVTPVEVGLEASALCFLSFVALWFPCNFTKLTTVLKFNTLFIAPPPPKPSTPKPTSAAAAVPLTPTPPIVPGSRGGMGPRLLLFSSRYYCCLLY